ncbi:ATP-grasp domain-containing protein [Candidatus Microgenomates bacterium]|nr:MAG: ATP-grasp domain-containing protein [Candidatus Microgenomates bacterium]
MKQKALLIIGAGPFSDRSIIWAKECGFVAIVVDKNDQASSLKFADVHIRCNGTNIRYIINWMKKNQNYAIVRAFGGNDFAVPTVFAINDYLAKKKRSHKHYQKLIDKVFIKRKLLRAGIPTPTYSLVETKTQAKQVVEKFGYPVIVKPNNLSGSVGVVKVSSVKDWNLIDFDRYPQSKWLLEPYVNGSHHDVNGLVIEARFYPCGISDRFFSTTQTDFVDKSARLPICGISPTTVTTQVQAKMYKILSAAAKVLEFNQTPIKGDFILNKKTEPVLIEITPRFHGEIESAYILPDSTGINPIYAHHAYFFGISNWQSYLNPKKTPSICAWRALLPNPKKKSILPTMINQLAKKNGIIKIIARSASRVRLYENNSEIPAFIVISVLKRTDVKKLFLEIEKMEVDSK